MSSEELIGALQELERRCRERGGAVSQQGKPQDAWAGVWFVVGERPLLSPLEEVAELLEVPQEITRVPSAKPWVCGVANNRGTLLPIFDLQAFLFGVSTARNSRNRVLVVRQQQPFGLLVGDVAGIRYLEQSARVPDAPSLGAGFDGLLAGGFAVGQQRCPVLSLQRLAFDSRFSLAAA